MYIIFRYISRVCFCARVYFTFIYMRWVVVWKRARSHVVFYMKIPFAMCVCCKTWAMYVRVFQQNVRECVVYERGCCIYFCDKRAPDRKWKSLIWTMWILWVVYGVGGWVHPVWYETAHNGVTEKGKWSIIFLYCHRCVAGAAAGWWSLFVLEPTNIHSHTHTLAWILAV